VGPFCQGESGVARVNPFKFAQEVRQEVSKIVWTTRRDLLVTTGIVFLMATLTAIFFFLIDQIIRFGLTSILEMF